MDWVLDSNKSEEFDQIEVVIFLLWRKRSFIAHNSKSN